MTANPWSGNTGWGSPEALPAPITPPERCDVCRGRRTLPNSDGSERECPFCHGAGTDQWRAVEDERQRRQWATSYVVRWILVLSYVAFAFWYYGHDTGSSSSDFATFFPIGLFAGLCFCLGYMVRLWIQRPRRMYHGQLTGGGEWLGLGAAGLFWAYKHRNRR